MSLFPPSELAAHPMSRLNHERQHSMEFHKSKIVFYKSQPKFLEEEEDQGAETGRGPYNESNNNILHNESIDLDFENEDENTLSESSKPVKVPSSPIAPYSILVSGRTPPKNPPSKELFPNLNNLTIRSCNNSDVSDQSQESILAECKMERSKSDKDMPSSPKNKWKRVKNVLRGISLFSTYQVQTISTPEDIQSHLNTRMTSPSRHSTEGSPCKTKPIDPSASEILTNLKREAHENAVREQFRLIDELKLRKQFFEAIENGSQEDLVFIKKYLLDDPKRYLLIEESPERRMNKIDALGQTPLYVAAKQGNIKVLEILKAFKANHKLPSTLGKEKVVTETALEVAARWGQLAAIEYMINNFDWNQKEYKSAKKASSNKLITKLLSQKLSS